MADFIVTPNLITVNTCDATTGIAIGGSSPTDALNIDTDVNIQGSGCAAWGLKNTGMYWMYATSSTVDMRNQHIYIWFNTLAQKMANTYVGKGINVFVGGVGAFNIANSALWTVDGSDTYPGGWQCYVIDTNRRADWSGSSWTSSAMQNVGKIGIVFSASVAGARAGNNVFLDAVRYGSGLTVYSGSSADPATWEGIYQADFTGSNKYGVIAKRGGVYFLQGQITIGSASLNTFFSDRNQIVEFESKMVSGSAYRINITGSNTTCSFGDVVGTGQDSIGISPIIYRGSNPYTKLPVTNGPVGFTQSLKPVFWLSPEVRRFTSYATRFDSLGDVNIGVSGSGTNTSQMILVDNTWATTHPIVKNTNTAFSISLNNKLVSTSQSYSPASASYAMILYDTSSINSSEFSIFNSYGFTSPPNFTTASYTLTNHNFTSNFRYITIYGNKTWNVINPTWITPNTQSLFFTVSQSNAVNEYYSLVAYTGTPTGTPITGSSIFIYEGTLSQSIVNRGLTDSTGSVYSNILKTSYLASGSIASPQFMASQSYGNFAIKAYKYGYTPYVASNPVTAPINSAIALIEDSAITEADQHVAMVLSSSVSVKKRTIPLAVIGYTSGSVAFSSGSGVTGSLSNARGYIVESIGTVAAGTVVIDRRNGVPFVERDVLRSDTTPYATASLSSSNGGFSGSYTWIVDCNSNGLSSVYDYLASEMAAWPISSSFEQVLTWGTNQQPQLMYAGGSGYFTERNTSTQQGVWLAKRGTGTMAYATSDGGTLYIPPVQYTLTLTGLIAGTEVRIYKKDDMTELAGVESSGTSFSYNYTYTGDITTYIQVVSVSYVDILIDDYVISNANASIPIQQQFDRNYRNQ
jgi:hypothetical protein